jgi:hypothetical protein
LYGKHPDTDIYVVGTGASMRVFPPSFWEGRVTIGLNMAWKVAPVRYGITIGPHLNVPEFMEGERPHPEITWITKRTKAEAVLAPEQFAYADAHFYYFEMDGQPNRQPLEEPSDAGRILDWVRRPTGVKLYQWSSISQTAVNLAANMGARNVVLAGCDNTALLDNHHSHEQHTKWLGADPARRYRQYYEGLVEIRSALRDRGVNLLTLNPFLKLDDPEGDFAFLCEELGLPSHLGGGDISEADHPRRFLERSAPAPSKLRRGLRRAKALARRSVSRNGKDEPSRGSR